MDLLNFLNEIVSTPAVTSAENLCIDLCKTYVGIDGEITPLGSCIFPIKGGTGTHYLIDAHIDQIGFVVTYVKGGFAKIAAVGGIDARILPATEIIFETGDVGIVCATPPHLSDGETKIDIKDMWVDLGGVDLPLGTLGTFKPVFNIAGEKIMGTALDNKSGVAAVIYACEKLKDIQSDCKISLLLSSFEETGEQGAKTALYGREVDKAIVVDVTFAQSPGVSAEKAGKLSEGPMIGISPILNKTMTENIKKVAEKYDIKYQLEVMAGRTGTNSDVITVNQGGIATAMISIPLKYMHTPNEVVDISDVIATGELIYRAIKAEV